MTTLGELATRCQAALADSSAGVWSEAQIQDWCLESIREYTRTFTRQRTASITTQANTRRYELPADFLDALQVEYPAGLEPPVTLDPGLASSPGFYRCSGLYDVEYSADPGEAPVLVLSALPQAGQTISIRYQGLHALALDETDALSVPPQHEPMLAAHVVWQAWQQLTSAEMAAPVSSSGLVMSQLAVNARAAWRRFESLRDTALLDAAPGRVAAAWPMDRWDRR